MSIGYDKKFNATRGAIRECKNAGGIAEPVEGEHFEVFKAESGQWQFRLLAEGAPIPGPGYGGPHLVSDESETATALPIDASGIIVDMPSLRPAGEDASEVAARSVLADARERMTAARRLVEDGAEPVMPVMPATKANAKRLRLVREADDAMRKGQVRWLRQLLVDARFCGPSVTGFIGLAIVYAEGVKARKKAG